MGLQGRRLAPLVDPVRLETIVVGRKFHETRCDAMLRGRAEAPFAHPCFSLLSHMLFWAPLTRHAVCVQDFTPAVCQGLSETGFGYHPCSVSGTTIRLEAAQPARGFVGRGQSGDGDESLSWSLGDARPSRHDARTGRVLGTAGRRATAVRCSISDAVLDQEADAILAMNQDGSQQGHDNARARVSAYEEARTGLFTQYAAASLVAWRGEPLAPAKPPA